MEADYSSRPEGGGVNGRASPHFRRLRKEAAVVNDPDSVAEQEGCEVGIPAMVRYAVILIAAKGLVGRPRLAKWGRRFFAALRMTVLRG